MENLPPLVWGYRWDHEVMERARQASRLLRASAAIPGGNSPGCNLKCIFCFTEGGDVYSDNIKITNDDVLTFMRDCSEFAFDKNQMSYFLVSDGEPSLNKGLANVLWELASLGGKITIFTNLFYLPDEIVDSYVNIKNLFVCGKLYGLRAATNDYLTGVTGAHDVMMKNIVKLATKGLASEGRLGVQCVVTTANSAEVLDLFKWGRANNIIPHVMMYREQGRGANHPELALSEQSLVAIFKQCAEYDFNKYGYSWLPSPPMLGIDKCFIPGVNLYLFGNGDVRVCAGDSRVMGNIRKDTVTTMMKTPLFNELRLGFKGCQWAINLHER